MNNSERGSNDPVVVYGAAGHTARFVVAELRRRGLTTVLAGRDQAALQALADESPGSQLRVVSTKDSNSLDRVLAGAAAVVNCAGPFADSAFAVVQSALRTGTHYLDICAEQVVAAEIMERYAEPARQAGIVIAPAMGFYGALGDLLATSAMGDWEQADQIELGIALDSWFPTRGTRRTVLRNTGRHLVFTGNQLVAPTEPPTTREWDFPEPAGRLIVTDLYTADQVTMSRHIRTPEIRVFINRTPIADLGDPATPAPTPVDGIGRSAQTFIVHAVVHRGGARRDAIARGQDIYAVTAPIVAEAVQRILDGRVRKTGTTAAGEAFDAKDFLHALEPEHLTLHPPIEVYLRPGP